MTRPSDECPDCTPRLGRRDFFRAAAAAAVAGAVPLPKARAKSRAAQEAEGYARELFAGLSADQKAKLAFPWDHGPKNGLPTRLGMYNAPITKTSIIGVEYDKKQVELLDKVFRNLADGEEGYRLLSRGGKFDNSGDFESIGATFYGEAVEGKKFSLVFAGHHLTVRCDGNSEESTAFGGPLYYGHSPNGYSDKNVFHFQTKSVWGVFDALDEKQRKVAVIPTLPAEPREQAGSVKFRKAGFPGLPVGELSKDQRALVEKVMRDLVAPYRKEDGDEVMALLKANGGLDKIGLAFYRDMTSTEQEPWHFWRLEGPGFVWNFRVLPHVHTFVNISSKLG